GHKPLDYILPERTGASAKAAGSPLDGGIGLAVSEREHRQLHAGAHVQLVKNRRQVVLDGLLRDTRRRGDVAVAEAAGDRRDDFPFAWTEAFGAHAPVDGRKVRISHSPAYNPPRPATHDGDLRGPVSHAPGSD